MYASSKSKETAQKEASRISGVSHVAFQRGAVFTGHVPVPLAQISYQIEGSRLFASVDAIEAISMMLEERKESLSITPEDSPVLLKDRLFTTD